MTYGSGETTAERYGRERAPEGLAKQLEGLAKRDYVTVQLLSPVCITSRLSIHPVFNGVAFDAYLSSTPTSPDRQTSTIKYVPDLRSLANPEPHPGHYPYASTGSRALARSTRYPKNTPHVASNFGAFTTLPIHPPTYPYPKSPSMTPRSPFATRVPTRAYGPIWTIKAQAFVFRIQGARESRGFVVVADDKANDKGLPVLRGHKDNGSSSP
ncbi:hypothetical protein BD779DRAFT_1694273 [Infundibulicybe gibba]|nr:hypothetical protein BD779DRAFT_1694273 [Infundibulicybe gibba]